MHAVSGTAGLCAVHRVYALLCRLLPMHALFLLLNRPAHVDGLVILVKLLQSISPLHIGLTEEWHAREPWFKMQLQRTSRRSSIRYCCGVWRM